MYSLTFSRGEVITAGNEGLWVDEGVYIDVYSHTQISTHTLELRREG